MEPNKDSSEATKSEFLVPETKKALPLDYTPPVWSGKPPEGSKLEILKGGAIIGGLEIKDKDFIVFGKHEPSVDVL